MHKKLSKQNEETQNINEVNNRNTKRKLVTPMEYKVSSLAHHQSKLKQLKARQTALPPDRE